MSMELLYTAVTRAQKHLTIFAQEDVTTWIGMSAYAISVFFGLIADVTVPTVIVPS